MTTYKSPVPGEPGVVRVLERKRKVVSLKYATDVAVNQFGSTAGELKAKALQRGLIEKTGAKVTASLIRSTGCWTPTALRLVAHLFIHDLCAAFTSVLP
jgi:hypothetical protein